MHAVWQDLRGLLEESQRAHAISHQVSWLNTRYIPLMEVYPVNGGRRASAHAIWWCRVRRVCYVCLRQGVLCILLVYYSVCCVYHWYIIGCVVCIIGILLGVLCVSVCLGLCVSVCDGEEGRVCPSVSYRPKAKRRCACVTACKSCACVPCMHASARLACACPFPYTSINGGYTSINGACVPCMHASARLACTCPFPFPPPLSSLTL